MSLLVHGLLLAVLVLAAFFIITELTAAGFFSRGRRSDRAAVRHDPAADGPAPPSEPDAVPLFDKPAILLRLLVKGLSRTGRLRADRHLTHRELVDRAVFDEDIQRQRFARVAGLARRFAHRGA
jgi:hypothetical protein